MPKISIKNIAHNKYLEQRNECTCESYNHIIKKNTLAYFSKAGNSMQFCPAATRNRMSDSWRDYTDTYALTKATAIYISSLILHLHSLEVNVLSFPGLQRIWHEVILNSWVHLHDVTTFPSYVNVMDDSGILQKLWPGSDSKRMGSGKQRNEDILTVVPYKLYTVSESCVVLTFDE